MLSYGLDEERYKPWVMQSTMRKLFNLEQGPNETMGTFTKWFKSQLAVMESVYGPLVPTTLKGKATAIQDAGRDKFLTCVFLAAMNRKQYKSTVDELCNDYQKAKDKTTTTFPETIESAQKLLMKRRCGSSQKDDYANGVLLLQATRTTDKSKKKKFRGKCHKCGKRGHFARDCTASETMMRIVVLAVVSGIQSNGLDSNWQLISVRRWKSGMQRRATSHFG